MVDKAIPQKKTLENKFTYTFSLIKNNPRALKDDFSSRTDPYPFESIMQIDQSSQNFSLLIPFLSVLKFSFQFKSQFKLLSKIRSLITLRVKCTSSEYMEIFQITSSR